MRKIIARLALGLGLIVNSAFPGTISGNSELEKQVQALSKDDNSCVVSCTRGIINAPLEVVRGYVENPVLSSKVTMALGNSPYFSKQEGEVFTFFHGGYTSRYQVVQKDSRDDSFNQVSLIDGNKRFGSFKSVMELYFKSSTNKTTRYANLMRVKIESNFIGSIIKGLLNAPFLGKRLRKNFEEEQDKIMGNINTSISRAKTNPELIEGLRSYTNGSVYFSSEEVDFIQKSVELSR